MYALVILKKLRRSKLLGQPADSGHEGDQASATHLVLSLTYACMHACTPLLVKV
jgi:hypothetical protein